MILTLLSPWRGRKVSALKQGGAKRQEASFVVRGSDLEQSLAEPHHDVQVHLSLWVSLLAVLVLALYNHIPEAAAQLSLTQIIGVKRYLNETVLTSINSWPAWSSYKRGR